MPLQKSLETYWMHHEYIFSNTFPQSGSDTSVFKWIEADLNLEFLLYINLRSSRAVKIAKATV